MKEVKDKEAVEVKSLRPGPRGTQNATIILAELDTKRLVACHKLRVEMGTIKVEERIDLLKCFRCWDYGHMASSCKGEDRAGACQKCGQTGHMAKECQNNNYCPLCKEERHEAGRRGCKTQKKALEKERKRRVENFNKQA